MAPAASEEAPAESPCTAAPAHAYLQLQSPFFGRLPAEVRNAIYAHYLAFKWAQPVARCGRLPTLAELVHAEAWPWVFPLPAAMAACRRLYRELAPRAHGRAALLLWRFSHSAPPPRPLDLFHRAACYGPLRWGPLRSLTVCAMMVCPWWDWAALLAAVFARAPCLRELVVEWQVRPADAELAERCASMRRRWLAEEEKELLAAIAEQRGLEVVRLGGAVPDSWVRFLEGRMEARIVRFGLAESQDRVFPFPDSSAYMDSCLYCK